MQPNSLVRKLFNISSAVVAIEALALIGASVWLLFEIISGQSKSIEAAAMLFALVALTAAWISMTAIRLRQFARWARSSAIFWQTCQLAIAASSFTGRGANAAIGIALIVPSLAILALQFSKPVLAFAKEQI